MPANSFATVQIVKKLDFPSVVSPPEWLKCGKFWLFIQNKTLDSITTGVKYIEDLFKVIPWKSIQKCKPS